MDHRIAPEPSLPEQIFSWTFRLPLLLATILYTQVVDTAELITDIFSYLIFCIVRRLDLLPPPPQCESAEIRSRGVIQAVLGRTAAETLRIFGIVPVYLPRAEYVPFDPDFVDGAGPDDADGPTAAAAVALAVALDGPDALRAQRARRRAAVEKATRAAPPRGEWVYASARLACRTSSASIEGVMTAKGGLCHYTDIPDAALWGSVTTCFLARGIRYATGARFDPPRLLPSLIPVGADGTRLAVPAAAATPAGFNLDAAVAPSVAAAPLQRFRLNGAAAQRAMAGSAIVAGPTWLHGARMLLGAAWHAVRGTRGAPSVGAEEAAHELSVWMPPEAAERVRAGAAGSGEASGLPVIVWVHGGAFVFGSGNGPMYDGRTLCVDGPCVVVQVQYRLGALGFMPLPGRPGNLGVRDVVCALRWVQRHIHRFGGDARRVTVMGESAGAMLLANLLAAPTCRGLFDQAILQSGACLHTHSAQQGASVTTLAARAAVSLGFIACPASTAADGDAEGIHTADSDAQAVRAFAAYALTAPVAELMGIQKHVGANTDDLYGKFLLGARFMPFQPWIEPAAAASASTATSAARQHLALLAAAGYEVHTPIPRHPHAALAVEDARCNATRVFMTRTMNEYSTFAAKSSGLRRATRSVSIQMDTTRRRIRQWAVALLRPHDAGDLDLSGPMAGEAQHARQTGGAAALEPRLSDAEERACDAVLQAYARTWARGRLRRPLVCVRDGGVHHIRRFLFAPPRVTSSPLSPSPGELHASPPASPETPAPLVAQTFWRRAAAVLLGINAEAVARFASSPTIPSDGSPEPGAPLQALPPMLSPRLGASQPASTPRAARDSRDGGERPDAATRLSGGLAQVERDESLTGPAAAAEVYSFAYESGALWCGVNGDFVFRAPLEALAQLLLRPTCRPHGAAAVVPAVSGGAAPPPSNYATTSDGGVASGAGDSTPPVEPRLEMERASRVRLFMARVDAPLDLWPALGATHCIDMPYVFGTLHREPYFAVDRWADAARRRLAWELRASVLLFAHGADPWDAAETHRAAAFRGAAAAARGSGLVLQRNRGIMTPVPSLPQLHHGESSTMMSSSGGGVQQRPVRWRKLGLALPDELVADRAVLGPVSQSAAFSYRCIATGPDAPVPNHAIMEEDRVVADGVDVDMAVWQPFINAIVDRR